MDDLFNIQIDTYDSKDDTKGSVSVLSSDEIEIFINLSTKLASNISFFESSACRQLRKTLHPLVDNLRKKSFGGKTRSDYEEKKMIYKDHLGRIARQKALDAKYLNSVKLREERLRKLKVLREENLDQNIPFIADGTADDITVPQPKDPLLNTNNAIFDVDANKSNTTTKSNVASVEDVGDNTQQPKALYRPRSCYVCKRRYTLLHTFYDMLCPDCAVLNFEKRKQTFDLTGFTCLITGGRVKIGYQVVLKLLRAGAHCIVTTRFPKDCTLRYAAVEDSANWLHRLDIFGLDFRDIHRLEQFCSYLMSTYETLDIIVNNACQTIRRPIKYYTPLLKTEMTDINELCDKDGNYINSNAPIDLSNTLHKQNIFEKTFHEKLVVPTTNRISTNNKGSKHSIDATSPTSSSSSLLPLDLSLANHLKKMLNSAEQSQIVVVKEDLLSTDKEFPKDTLDVNGQQIDLRKTNTWITPMEDVDVGEATEVFAINALAPFVINSKLIPLLEKGNENKDRYKFIVNVSAMEGKFNRVKSGYHPHTNMAKAALNMMTATSSKKLIKKNIFMTSVDTGWINEENPLEKASKYAKKHNFQTPLDEIDAASRILDPIFNGLKSKKPQFGVFYKDYHETEW